MRGLSDNTRSTYLHCVVMFVGHFKRSPSEPSALARIDPPPLTKTGPSPRVARLDAATVMERLA